MALKNNTVYNVNLSGEQIKLMIPILYKYMSGYTSKKTKVILKSLIDTLKNDTREARST